MGSSREQAAQALRILGVQAVVARSFGGIFYRNAFNLGLLALVSEETERVGLGDSLKIDAAAGLIVNETNGEEIACEPVPPHLLSIVRAGGLIPYLEERFKGDGTC